ncbi:Tetratricopeptide repeat protein like [Actinidia chinensis var. chinensis]|uniref:Tetratricopeptide repeat protein like n=1 Tax=Actinidia chinensis var. chinensis TaxID=1590841 RepID=A0A2R6RV76_ACTCC|nr:Tetratricopeptide repeat protein like [Actinidia chinensis var. chinensis]
MLIKTMRDLYCDKWKADNGQFRSGFYAELEKHIILTFLGTDLRASPHIESKTKLWRRHYNLLTDMLCLSGFGWDDCSKMVTVDSMDVWETHARREPDAKDMLNRPFPCHED